jgi:hypothetical protein
MHHKELEAWGSVVVKAMRYKSEGLGIDPQRCCCGIFPQLPTEPCALGSTQPLKMSTRKTPEGKDGRCVWVKTLPPSQCRKSRKSGSLDLPGPQGPAWPVAGKLYLYHKEQNLHADAGDVSKYIKIAKVFTGARIQILVSLVFMIRYCLAQG